MKNASISRAITDNMEHSKNLPILKRNIIINISIIFIIALRNNNKPLI